MRHRFLSLCLPCMLFYVGNGLKIAAFNLQVFGPSKASNAETINTLTKIVHRYDIILLQEIRDKTGKAIDILLENVNKGGQGYQKIASTRLGRTSSKEQYIFLYRATAGVSVTDQYQYSDPGDKFEREPFTVLFQSESSAIDRFALMAVHIAPGDAEEEINKLVNAHQAVKNRWKMDDILILGDLNADCSYMSQKKLKASQLRDGEYRWLIPDNADTTVAKTDCAYDRFVMTGENFLDSVRVGSAKVFRFDQAFNLANDKAKAVSDHYPIEIEILGDYTASAGNSTHLGVRAILQWLCVCASQPTNACMAVLLLLMLALAY